MKALVLTVLSAVIGQVVNAQAMSVTPTVPMVQQEIEMVVSLQNCKTPTSLVYEPTCFIEPKSLNLPRGGKLIEGVSNDVFSVGVGSLSAQYAGYITINVMPANREIDGSAFKALVAAGQTKIRVIYQGPEISK